MRLETVTHGMSKKPMRMDIDEIWSWYFSDASKCTVLVAKSGGVLPVLESVEEIEKLKKGEKVNG